MFIEKLRIDGLLSFAPGSPEIELAPLNVLIGPNGSGKTNLIEVIELLRAVAEGNLVERVRLSGGMLELLWRGSSGGDSSIEATLIDKALHLAYRLDLAEANLQVVITDESLRDVGELPERLPYFQRFYRGAPLILERDEEGNLDERKLQPHFFARAGSVFETFRDWEVYGEITACREFFANIRSFREWSFGRETPVRRAARADMPGNVLLPQGSNLPLLIQRYEHLGAASELVTFLRRFLPRLTRVSTLVEGGAIQLYFHEEGLSTPIPASRMSDGTLRFLALAALLLDPSPPPLLCIEEPELGLHPDALSLVADLLVAASQRMQLIVTTHSESLISALTAHVESVMVCEYLGGTRFERLEAKKLDDWLDEYTLGDLWARGTIGGNP